MEKANDIAKSIHHQHSNKIDACVNILKDSMRQLQLKHMKEKAGNIQRETLCIGNKTSSKRDKELSILLRLNTLGRKIQLKSYLFQM